MCHYPFGKKNNKGFTLVEIMVVVGIIALLAAIIIPNFLTARVQANEASAQAALKTIATAMENYAAINNVYPIATSALTSASPPYINVNYFTGTHNGYQFTDTLTQATYQILAVPITSSHGTKSFSMTTGGVLSEM